MNLPQPNRLPQVQSFGNSVLSFDQPASQENEIQLAIPYAITVPSEKLAIKTHGCLFPEGIKALSPNPKPVSDREQKSEHAPLPKTRLGNSGVKKTKNQTRVRPPRDVVKLEDRLF